MWAVSREVNHLNDIDNFWNQAKRVLRNYNGVPKESFQYSSRNVSSDSTTEVRNYN